MGGERVVELSDGTRLWAASEGEGPPLLLCHGGPGLWDYLDGLSALLRDRFTVHRWDQRGCGRSGGEEVYGFDVAVADVQRLRAALGGRGPWGVVGHSWGAQLSLLTAVEHPDTTAGVVYLSGIGDPSWWREVGHDAYHRERTARLSAGERDRLADLAAMERIPAEEAEYRTLSWITDYADRGVAMPAMAGMVASPCRINGALNRALGPSHATDEARLHAQMERCRVPFLFLHGTADPRPDGGARLLAERVPGSAFATIDGAGHLPWVERPGEVARRITAFFEPILRD